MNRLLEEAINIGDVNLTKKLLESGATLPKQYRYNELPSYERNLYSLSSNTRDFTKSLNSKYAQYVPDKLENFRSLLTKNNNLDEQKADSLANMLSQVNQFDYALSKAVNGGFIESRIIDLNDSTDRVVEWKEQTDMLKGRRKLASFVLNHYASDEGNKIDLLSRFESLKESLPRTDPNREAWRQTYNLIAKHIDLGKEQTTEIATSNQKQGDDDNPPSANSSVVSFTDLVTQSAPPIQQPAEPPIEQPASSYASFNLDILDLDESKPLDELDEQISNWAEKVSQLKKKTSHKGKS